MIYGICRLNRSTLTTALRAPSVFIYLRAFFCPLRWATEVRLKPTLDTEQPILTPPHLFSCSQLPQFTVLNLFPFHSPHIFSPFIWTSVRYIFQLVSVFALIHTLECAHTNTSKSKYCLDNTHRTLNSFNCVFFGKWMCFAVWNVKWN